MSHKEKTETSLIGGVFLYLLKPVILPPHALTIRPPPYPFPLFPPRWTH